MCVSCKWWQKGIKREAQKQNNFHMVDSYLTFLSLVNCKGSLSVWRSLCPCMFANVGFTCDLVCNTASQRAAVHWPAVFPLTPRLGFGRRCWTTERLWLSVDKSTAVGIVASYPVRRAADGWWRLRRSGSVEISLPPFSGQNIHREPRPLSCNTCTHGALKQQSPFWSPSFLLRPAA